MYKATIVIPNINGKGWLKAVSYTHLTLPTIA